MNSRVELLRIVERTNGGGELNYRKGCLHTNTYSEREGSKVSGELGDFFGICGITERERERGQGLEWRRGRNGRICGEGGRERERVASWVCFGMMRERKRRERYFIP